MANIVELQPGEYNIEGLSTDEILLLQKLILDQTEAVYHPLHREHEKDLRAIAMKIDKFVR